MNIKLYIDNEFYSTTVLQGPYSDFEAYVENNNKEDSDFRFEIFDGTKKITDLSLVFSNIIKGCFESMGHEDKSITLLACINDYKFRFNPEEFRDLTYKELTYDLILLENTELVDHYLNYISEGIAYEEISALLEYVDIEKYFLENVNCVKFYNYYLLF